MPYMKFFQTWYANASVRGNVFSLWAPSESCLLFMWSEKSIPCLVPFVSLALSTVYDLSWPGEQAPVWGQCELGVVTMAHSACPAPLRTDNQGPLVIVTRACRPHRPGGTCLRKNSSPPSFLHNFSWSQPISSRTKGNDFLSNLREMVGLPN